MNSKLAIAGTLALSIGAGWGMGGLGRPGVELTSRSGQIGGRSPASVDPHGAGARATASVPAAEPAKRIPPEKIAQLEKQVDALALTGPEKEFSAAMGNDPHSQRIRRMILGGLHTEQMPESGMLGMDYFRDFQDDPTHAAEAIEKALAMKEMSDKGLYAGRAALLTALSQLPGQLSEAQRLAVQEIVNHPIEARPDFAQATSEEELNRALSSTPQMNLPITAHAILLGAATDMGSALPTTVDGIVAQPDMGIRNTLGRQFVEKFPDSEAALRATLAEKGIKLTAELTPDPKAQARGETMLIPALPNPPQGGGQ